MDRWKERLLLIKLTIIMRLFFLFFSWGRTFLRERHLVSEQFGVADFLSACSRTSDLTAVPRAPFRFTRSSLCARVVEAAVKAKPSLPLLTEGPFCVSATRVSFGLSLVIRRALPSKRR